MQITIAVCKLSFSLERNVFDVTYKKSPKFSINSLHCREVLSFTVPVTLAALGKSFVDQEKQLVFLYNLVLNNLSYFFKVSKRGLCCNKNPQSITKFLMKVQAFGKSSLGGSPWSNKNTMQRLSGIVQLYSPALNSIYSRFSLPPH